jgi:hypothetical protein
MASRVCVTLRGRACRRSREILRLLATNSAAVANQPVSSKRGVRDQFDRVLNLPATLARGRVGPYRRSEQPIYCAR